MMRKTTAILALFAILSILPACNRKEDIKPAKNVIFMVVDGCSNGALTLSRWYKEYTQNTQEGLSFDPYICGQMRSCHINAPIAGSAGAMTTLMTGELVRKNNICVYPAPKPGTAPDADMYPADSSLALRPLATLAEAARCELGKSIGIVVTTYFCHATPAAVAAHAYSRNEYSSIAAQLASSADVVFGGGVKYLTPKAKSILDVRGIPYIENDVQAFRNWDGDRLWACLSRSGMGYDMDHGPETPSLAEMTSKAIRALSRNRKGFFLMVEGSAVDFAAHAHDPAGIVSEVLSFEKAVRVALDFARRDGNTVVVVTADHGTSGVVLGDADYSAYSKHNIATALGGLPDIKVSTKFLTDRLADVRPEDMKDTVLKYSGIQMTPEEERSLQDACGKIEDDYMEVTHTQNVQSALGAIYSARTHVGYSSGNHSGEDVFYAVYTPRGARPEGFVTNVRLSQAICGFLGLKKPLRSYTEDYFAPASEVAGEFTIRSDAWDDPAIELPLSGGRTALLSASSSIAKVGDRTVQLRTPVVRVSRSKEFYVPRDLMVQIGE